MKRDNTLGPGSAAAAPWAAAVNRFWFEEKGPTDWFGGGPALDEEIRRRFGDVYRAVSAKPPPAEVLDAMGVVAAVIVLDQFPRNMFRGSAEAFASDASALSLSRHAVASGMDSGLGWRQRQFLYLPFMHAENPAVQARSVALFGSLEDAELLAFAEQHRDVIARFGRFPGRNAALGRTSTDEERQFLAERTTSW